MLEQFVMLAETNVVSVVLDVAGLTSIIGISSCWAG
jgi:hypothetical protein